MGDNRKHEFEWIRIPEEKPVTHFESEYFMESKLEKVFKSMLGNPLVPIGTMVTVGAFVYGVLNMYRGNSQMQQQMMRLRVGAQFVTVMALTGAAGIAGMKGSIKDIFKIGGD